jgi:hypothetical protein
MVIGGAAVVVITLAVASAVTITNAAALRDSSGQALAASTITLPADPAAAAMPKVSGHAGSTSSAPSGSSSATTAELVPAPGAVTVAAPVSREAVVTATDASSSATATKASVAHPAQANDSTAKQKHHVRGSASVKGKKVTHPHVLPRIAQAPALVAGHQSGKKESPSSGAGSKKGQWPHSPDARD